VVVTPTLRELVLRIVADAFPALVYGVPRTYIVQSVRADGRLDLSPPPDAVALPELVNVEPWTLNGVVVTPTAGTEVVVVFRDASPTRPIVVGYVQGIASGGASPNATTPSRLEVDATAMVTVGASASAVELAGMQSDTILVPGTEAGRVVRYGDVIMFPSGAAAIPTALPILGSAPGAIGAPLPPISAARVKA